MDNKKFAELKINEKSEVFTSLSDRIWDYAELSLKEFRSTEDYVRTLTSLGFEVETNIAGLPTAFSGKFGTGYPVVAILGEFDALSGLSQVGGKPTKEERTPGGNGHGCGHNMLGAGALAAAYGVKCYLEETKREGTVIFYGTPGEEGGAGKAYMAKMGIFDGVDAALTWHPGDANEVVTGTCNSCIQVLYKFKGVAAHAAGDPENGRSALDALELMNVGVQFLREHSKDDARIHYSVIDAGGTSPNVVQSSASVLYMIRSKLVEDANKLAARVDKIAAGAAMMTETEYEKVFIDGCSNTVTNHTLERIMFDNLSSFPPIDYTDEERDFAKKLKATYDNDQIPGIAPLYDDDVRERVAEMCDNGKSALCDFVVPLHTGYHFSPGSTDVGDVSWIVPTAQIDVTCFTLGAPGHSWQNVSVGRTSIGHKGLLRAGCVIAATAIDLFEDPSLIEKAKAEHRKATKGVFVSPIPDGETIKAI